MGFKEICFIGVGYLFGTGINSKGEFAAYNTVKDYFTDKFIEDKKDLYIPITEKSTLIYITMKRQCDKRNISVYNATREGKLEVF